MLLIGVAGMFNAVMDTLQHHHGVSIFKDLPTTSFFGKDNWVRKYKDMNPMQKRRFFGSKGIFVWAMDGWHLSQMLMISSIILAVMTFDKVVLADDLSLVVIYLLYHASWSGIFELFYSWVLISKK